MIEPIAPFNSPDYIRINRAREVWLRRVITLIPFRNELRTAVDVGCGAGYFSKLLSDLGFSVTGIDLRQGHVESCRRRYPQCTFLQANLDRMDALEEQGIGHYDLALIFGLLYHLQSPLQTVNLLARQVRRLCIVSTRVARGNAMACYLYRENKGEDQNSAPLVTVPTIPAVLCIFGEAGFGCLYQPDFQPDHEQWDPVQTPGGRRFSFIAAREPIDCHGFRKLDAPPPMQKWMNDPNEDQPS